MKTTVSHEVGGRTLSLTTGELAKQASGAVLVQYGETAVFVAAQTGPPRPGLDFFPLTVDYRERMAAAGKFPGGFLKREGRPTNREILTCRGFSEMALQGNTRQRSSQSRRYQQGTLRFLFAPHLKLLATIPVDNRQITVREFDLRERLAMQRGDFVFVDSLPPLTARAGQKLRYAIGAHSRPAQCDYEIIEGPHGMKVNRRGLVQWRVPNKSVARTEHIVVRVQAGSDEWFHAFPLRITQESSQAAEGE